LIVKIDKSFNKDTDKIGDKKLLLKIAHAIESVIEVNSITEIKNLKKLKSSSQHFRIKIGDYRLGFALVDETIIFERCLHRKDIYKYFPK
jgi:mRNA interferase RelE/StbE